MKTGFCIYTYTKVEIVIVRMFYIRFYIGHTGSEEDATLFQAFKKTN